jgi:hypothetical protein
MDAPPKECREWEIFFLLGIMGGSEGETTFFKESSQSSQTSQTEIFFKINKIKCVGIVKSIIFV